MLNSSISQFGARMKKSTKLHKLMAVYYQQKEIQINTLRFLHEGRPVRGWDTVAKAGLEDGDRLDAMSSMDGGGSILKTSK
ncbi:small ubiquitin-related modifier 2-like isoform X2 [Asparagus officinalis]|uniref:small ubiquitin-related modifier 2-like isoform X2 n=1 Tax=Asparagus officinalis TaxID=4686 RepID=UPI00098E2E45|nr:small ubiquitin-related modifier 2-like isoform X2 [Asparagus officinalis]